MPPRVLSIAVASGRVGYVFLVGEHVKKWHVSTAAAASPITAGEWAHKLILELKPNLLVTEDRGNDCRKGLAARTAMDAITKVGTYHNLEQSFVVHRHKYANKYAEAAALAAKYPVLRSRVPHRAQWDAEPKHTVIFEALSLALAALKEQKGSEEP